MSAPIRVKKLRPGDDTDTYCGRCKAERAHQIVALNADGTPATVICRTCGGQRRFREKKDTTAAPSAGAKRRAAAPARSASRAPEPSAVRPYSPRGTYAAGDWIEHAKFGQGRVLEARAGKIDVRFESGSRTLLHAG
ncbi:MAG TPA: hypothetical protein VJ866_11405 [Pyrinomonadaceae bacterium]|nr:hypothetical protein [Pyrinomonadaceae bacterium]